MTGDIACGKIRRVMVYRLDRLSRSVGDFSKMWEFFERYGVEFSSISEQFDTSNPIGKAMVYIIMTFAQLERETIAERYRTIIIRASVREPGPAAELPSVSATRV